jgi:hypothetical protein
MLRFIPTEPTPKSLKDKAASGMNGSVAARKAIQDQLHRQLRKELGR